ncbi:hypothetical protein K0U27_04185 [archaeon]|nr:hypothetical protein [archaeon]
MSSQTRPMGVTIIAVLEIISGIIAIAFGALFGALMGGIGMGVGSSMMGGEFAGIFGIVGGITAVLGVISFVMAWGLLKGKSWAWTITLILTIISLIFDVPSMNVIGIIIDVIILYYLFRPHVKAYFGKGAQVL